VERLSDIANRGRGFSIRYIDMWRFWHRPSTYYCICPEFA
jgi:hypothetical protein